MKLAVIGLGIGKVHAQVISQHPDLQLVGVCDLRADTAQEVAAQYGTEAFTDWQELVDRAAPEAVCLCTNPKTHLPLGLALAERGIHILCEKPMAPTVQQCLDLADGCAQAGVVLMIGQKKRFTPAFAFLKERVGGAFGRPPSLNYRYHLGQVPRDWFWQEDDGGGPILENSVHTFDALRYLIGEIKTIRGLGGNLLNPDRAPQLDVALGLLEFENGCIGAVELGTASEWAVADEELFIACEQTVVRSRGGFDRPAEIVYLERGAAAPETFAVDYSAEQGARDFIAEITHFVDCIHTGQTPLVTGRDAARSIACCLAMKRAVREGRTVELAEEWPE
jgi:UDP-N-acetylglucosamine 3-dehydrogenase